MCAAWQYLCQSIEDFWNRNNQTVFLNAKQLHKKHPEGQTLENLFYLRKQPSLLLSLSSLMLLLLEAETEPDPS